MGPTSVIRRAWAPLAVLAGFAVSATVVALRDPHISGSYGGCPSLLIFGVPCPVCGGLRATNSLLNGDFAAAWQSNPLWIIALPILLVAWAQWLISSARGTSLPRWITSSRTAVVFLVVVVGFGIARNIPGLQPYLGP